MKFARNFCVLEPIKKQEIFIFGTMGIYKKMRTLGPHFLMKNLGLIYLSYF